MTMQRFLVATGVVFYSLALGLAFVEHTGETAVAIMLAIALALTTARGHAARLIPRVRVWLIVAIGVGLRFSWAAFARLRPVNDYEVFWNAAERFVSNPLGVLATTKSPGAVLYYAAIRGAFDDSLTAVHLFNALLGGLQIFLVHRIAQRLFGSRAACAAAAIYALFPSLVFYSGVVSSEAPFLCSMLAGTLLFLRGEDTRATARAGRFVAGTGAFALAYLTRAVGSLFWIAGLSCWVAGTLRSRRALVAVAGIALFALLCLPQMVSNQRTYGWPIPAPSVAGDLNLLFGTNREHGGWWNQDDIDLVASMGGTLAPERIREFMGNARRAALDRIADDPLGFLAFALSEKYAAMWSSDRGGADWAAASSPRFTVGGGASDPTFFDRGDLLRISNVFYLLVCVGGFVSCTHALRRRDVARALTPILLPVVLVALLHVLLEVQPRYHLVVLPHLSILASARFGRAQRGADGNGKRTEEAAAKRF